MASVYLVAVYQSCELVSSGVAPYMLWLAIPYLISVDSKQSLPPGIYLAR